MIEKISPAKSGIQLGILFGVIMVLEFVIMYVIGMESLIGSPIGLIVNLLNFIGLPIIFIYLGCKNYKTNLNNGFITFSECLKVGVSILVIGALIYAVFNVIFNLIFPDFIDQMLSIIRKETIKKAPGIKSAELELILSMQRKFMNPVIAFPATIAMYAFFGLIYSLIIGAFVKNEKPESF